MTMAATDSSAIDSALLDSLHTHKSILESELASLIATRNAHARCLLNTSASAADAPVDQDLQTGRNELTGEEVAQALARAKQIKEKHISELGRYNEIRDIGFGLVGLIGEMRGLRIVDVLKELGVEED